MPYYQQRKGFFDYACHGPINVNLKQLGKAPKRQCLNDTSYLAIGHNTNAYQIPHHNLKHQRHQYIILVDGNFATNLPEKMITHYILTGMIAKPTNPL